MLIHILHCDDLGLFLQILSCGQHTSSKNKFATFVELVGATESYLTALRFVYVFQKATM